jgi:hypothetical protein
LKTCPHCANINNDDDANCSHCGKRVKGDFGFLTYLLMTVVLMLAVGGFFFWPLWVIALITVSTIKIRI